jgi:hypothetical protein
MQYHVVLLRNLFAIAATTLSDNWLGVSGMYSKPDVPNFITGFGRGLRRADSSRGMITSAMLGSLGAFEGSGANGAVGSATLPC